MSPIQGNFEFIAEYAFPKELHNKSGFLMIQISKIFEEFLERKLALIQITLKQFMVMLTVSDLGPISQQRLSEILEIDRTTMVFIMDEFEKMKWIQRNVNPHDRRAHAVTLTGHGRSYLKKAMMLVDSAHLDFISEMSKDDRRSLQSSISNLFESIKNINY